MPVSGLVVTLDEDGGLGESALVRLSDPRVAVGERVGNHIPVVTDTDTIAQARELLEAIEGLDGVLTAAVVSIDFSEAEAPGAHS